MKHLLPQSLLILSLLLLYNSCDWFEKRRVEDCKNRLEIEHLAAPGNETILNKDLGGTFQKTYNSRIEHTSDGYYYLGYTKDESAQNRQVIIVLTDEGSFSTVVDASNKYRFGKVNNNGAIVQSKELSFHARNLISVPSNATIYPNAALICGSTSTTGIFNGVIALHHNDILDEISQYTIISEAWHIWLNDVVVFNHPTMPNTLSVRVAGRAESKSDDKIYPYICELNINSDGSVSMEAEHIFTDFDSSYFLNIKTHSTGYIALATNINNDFLTVVSLTDDLDKAWESILTNPEGGKIFCKGSQHLALSDDRVFVVGYVEDEKAAPSFGVVGDALLVIENAQVVKDDKYVSSSGYAASLNLSDGTSRWTKVYDLSVNYFDGFFSTRFDAGSLYVGGFATIWCYERCSGSLSGCYSYGFLGELDPVNGDPISNRAYGKEREFTEYFDFEVKDGRCITAGFEGKDENEEAYYQASVVRMECL